MVGIDDVALSHLSSEARENVLEAIRSALASMKASAPRDLSHPVEQKLFQNEHLSVSRLKLYEQCPRAFFYKYVDKGPIEPFGDAAKFGVALHAGLEGGLGWLIKGEEAGRFPLDATLEAYRHEWSATGMTGVALYQEGLAILREYAERHAWIDPMTILGTEIEFNIEVDGFKVNGFMDRVDKIGDSAIRIRDYKSNRMLYTREELDGDLQMPVYGLAARVLWPWASQVEYVFDMLRHGTEQPTVRTADQLDATAQYVGDLGRRTETDTTWAMKPNPNCSYCDSRKRCPKWAEMLVQGHELTAVDTGRLGDVAREKMKAGVVAKAAYARQAEMDGILKKHLTVVGDYEIDGFSVKAINASSVEYPDAGAVVRAFVKAGQDAASAMDRVLVVDKDKVAELLEEAAPKKLPTSKGLMLRAELDSLKRVTPMTPKLSVTAQKTAAKVKAKDLADEASGKGQKKGTARP